MLVSNETRARRILFWPSRSGWTRLEIILFVLLIVIAVVLRVVLLAQVPPGMQHDEVFDARFATYILNGARPVFIDENTGVPPLFMYLVAGAFALFGRDFLVLRMTSVSIGILGLVVSYLFLRELVGRRVAMLTLAGLAMSFWHLFDSRVGIEPIIVPLMTGLSFYLFWQAFRRGSIIWYGLAGAVMGLAQYGHRTGPLIPLTVGIFALCLLASRHHLTDSEGRPIPRFHALAKLLLMFAVAGFVATPLIIHMAGNAGDSMLRIRQLSQDVTSLFAGDPQPVLEDILGVAGMFGIRGDPEWRYNVAGRPIFDPITGFLFWAGVIVSLSRIRQPAYLFLLLWLPINLTMAAITSPSPASTRALGSIAPIYAMPAIALVAGWDWLAAKQMARGKIALAGLAGLLLMGNAVWTVWDYFFVWPSNAVVRAIYRADLALAAQFLDASDPEGVVGISAQFAADLDQQAFDYILRDKRPIKWFDGRLVVVIPAQPAGEAATYLFPATDPATPFTHRFLTDAGAEVERIAYPTGETALTVYRLTAEQVSALREDTQSSPGRELNINLGNEIDLIGYDLSTEVRAGDPIDLTVYWRVRRGGRGELSYAFFAHVIDERGFRWTQDDPTGFPPSSWWADDLVVQVFHLTMPADAPPGFYHIDLGFYEQNSGNRLAEVNADGSEGTNVIRLQPFVVTASQHPAGDIAIDIAERVDARFGNRLQLLGYDISDRVLNLEDRVELALTWQALEDNALDVEIELTLIDEDGRPLPPIRRRLVDGAYPLNRWTEGQVVRDRFYLAHTTDIPRSIYDLFIAVQDAESGAYLPAPGGEVRVHLGQVFMRGLRE